MRRAGFIDRDGVLNEDRAYVHRIEDFHFIPGAIEALRRLQQAGFLLVLVTNQSGIARGLFTEADYQQLDRHIRERLLQSGVSLDSVQYCPHLPDAAVEQYRRDCECRKPRPGMILTAATELDIDLPRSFFVGDRKSDIEAGRAAGVGRCFLVRSGQSLSAADILLADGVYDDLAQCVAVQLKNGS
jgi:D-glycero-D-manno-heptose 1,7-bisphosphate phosphatase